MSKHVTGECKANVICDATLLIVGNIVTLKHAI